MNNKNPEPMNWVAILKKQRRIVAAAKGDDRVYERAVLAAMEVARWKHRPA